MKIMYMFIDMCIIFGIYLSKNSLPFNLLKGSTKRTLIELELVFFCQNCCIVIASSYNLTLMTTLNNHFSHKTNPCHLVHIAIYGLDSMQVTK